MRDESVRRGDIYVAELGEPAGTRPVLVLQNDWLNRGSISTVVAAITSKEKADITCNVRIGLEGGLKVPSTVVCNRIFTVDKTVLDGRVGSLSAETMKRVDAAIRSSIGGTI